MPDYMAGDQYEPTPTGMPNGGTPDWWMQNMPPGAAPGGIGQDVPGTMDDDPMTWPTQPTAPAGDWTYPSGGTPNPPLPGATRDSVPGAPDQTIMGGATWGGPISPFEGQYPVFTPPPLPDQLKNPWALPTAAELQATPGYMERFRMGLQARDRSAAARGTLLNGGQQQALARYGQDYASNEYGNAVGNSLHQRQQASTDYLNLAYGPAWQQNQAAVNQYGQLYNQYQDLVNNNRNAQGDYWRQQTDLLNAGLGAARSGAPGSTGGQG